MRKEQSEIYIIEELREDSGISYFYFCQYNFD